MDLKGKTILLTGARRIGKTVLQELVKRGARVAVAYSSTMPDLLGISGDVKTFQADLSQEAHVVQLVREVKKHFGAIHGLVHMAASYPRTPWQTLSEKDWDTTLDVIAKSTFLLGKHVGDELLKNAGEVKGKIITISDWSVLLHPYKEYLPYNAAKAAVEGITKSLAVELAPHVLVNCVAPGPILRPPDLDDAENAEALSRTPLGRWGGAEEIAKAILYFLDADFVTGQVLAVDGGRSIG